MRKPLTAAQKAARKARRIARELAAPDREREKPIQDRIMEALTALGCLVERRGENQGKRNDNHTPGEPDLRVSYRGLTFGIEVKRDAKEELRDDQIAWYRANKHNVPYFVCCDEKQAVATFHYAVGILEDYPLAGGAAFDMRSSYLSRLK